MTLMQILWAITTLASGLSVIGMLHIYHSMERSMDVLTRTLHEMIIQQGVLAYGTAIQRVAEDTEVAE
jgi:hypothetical protein